MERKEKNNKKGVRKKLHTVKYKKACYSCNTQDYLTIMFCKTILRCRRLFRQIKVIIPAKDLIMYLCVLGAWLLFIGGNYVIDKNLMGINNVNAFSLIKEFRGSVFTTIFIAFLINSINHILEYKKILRYQYFVYINTMLCFDSLFFNMYKGSIEIVYDPLYNSNRLTQIRELFRSEWENLVFDSIEVRDCWKNIYTQVIENERDYKAGIIEVKNVENFLNYNRTLKETFAGYVNYYDNQMVFEYVAWTLLSYLDELRFVWRKDTDVDKKVIKVLGSYKENNTVLFTYFRPWLKELGIEDLRK